MAERNVVWPLGARIREARKAAGLGVNRAAKRAHIAPTTWTSIEEGTRIPQGGADPRRTRPDVKSVLAAALVVGIDINEALELGGYEPLSPDAYVTPAPAAPAEPDQAGWLELKVIRERDGWELGKLADAAGLSRETLRLYERGQRNPSAASVRALAEVLKVPYSVLAPSPRDNDAPAAPEPPKQTRRAAAHMSGPQPGRRRGVMSSGSGHDEGGRGPAMPEPRPAQSRA
jgi:transcriptional regulator with XRE-family HTH domain